MNLQEPLKGLLIALTASGLTLGLHTVIVNPTAPRAPGPAPLELSRDAGFESLLARLEARLGEPRQLLAAPAATPANLRVASAPAETAEGTQEILERLADIERKLSRRPTIVHELQPLDRQRAPDVVALRAAIELQLSDRKASEFDLHMRTMHEMVERFGYPNEAAACGGGNCEFYWKYELPSADPATPNYFCAYFQGGLVLWTESRWTE